ncbi:MAG: hypothetical protein GY806_09385 [Gammaproteobacteria bacterium]|nr:hypothetical protein [Gammaproteobacteria bacterium]
MSGIDNKPIRYLLQIINYTVFMGMIWYFASAPSFTVLEEDQAVITMAFSHAGQLREACRRLSQEELNNLAPNMRKLEDCPRERSPVVIEMKLDGEILYNKSLQPPGLYEDGGVDIYFSQKIPAGEHQFEVSMDDSVRGKGVEHRYAQTVEVAASKILLVEFESDTGFVVR